MTTSDGAAIRLAEESDFEIGALCVRPSACEIGRSGGSVRVEPRVMQVLVSLSRRMGETVSRERLLEECWGGTAVSDDALVRSVSQLRKALGNGEGGVIVDTVPKVGYRLVVATNGLVAPGASGGMRLSRLAALGAGTAAAVALALVLLDGGTPDPVPPDTPRLSTPLTSLPGLEQWPAISPSGGQVAYSWAREPGAARDIYVQSVGEDSRMRLTDSGEDEYHPVWSPDGGRVAFVRRGEDGCSIHAVSPFAGSVARLARCRHSEVMALDWSPSGDRLVYTARAGALAPGRAFLVDLSDATETPVLTPETPTASVEEVAFSPDGGRIAFTLSVALGVEDLYVGDPTLGTTTRVTHDELKIHGFDWLPDGTGFVVSSNRGGEFALWRVSLEGDGWAPVPGAVGGADEPDASASGRVVYEAWRSRAGIWRAAPKSLEDPVPLVSSTRYEWDAERSPDGERIAFVSDRGGSAEVWIADAVGEGARRLTDFGGAYTHTPRFSPDGREVAFATPAAGNFDLYVVDVGSGELTRLTTDPAEDFAPAWSRDGESLYFGSTRTGEWQIWRLEVATERTVQLTTAGGRTAQPSSDGRWLYLVKADRAGLFRLELLPDGAAEAIVLEDLEPVDWNNWQVTDRAVYYVRRPEPGRPELARYDLAMRRTESLGALPELLHKSGLWISPDESEVLFTRVGDVEADILLVELGGLTARR